MSTEVGWLLIAIGVGLALVSWAMLAASRMSAAGPTGTGNAASRALLTAGLIVGVQWSVIGPTGPKVVSALVLGLPAFLAGATVARLLKALRTASRHQRTRTGRHP